MPETLNFATGFPGPVSIDVPDPVLARRMTIGTVSTVAQRTGIADQAARRAFSLAFSVTQHFPRMG